MKLRLYFILLLIPFSLRSTAQKIGEEMYIYHNNGEVNGFIPNEIISIEFSDTDADGKSYNEIVTQIVNTLDSIYIIPLAEIDSISFVTPKTEYQSDVVNLSESLMQYISGSDSLTIHLLSSTPEKILPTKGTKLVTLEMNDKFPSGFAGEVVHVNQLSSGYEIECKLTNLEDIFKTYYNVTSAYGYEEQTASGTRQSWFNNPWDWGIDKKLNLHKITWNYGKELNREVSNNGDWALKGETELSIGITPRIHILSTMIVNQREGVYFKGCVTGALDLEENLSIFGTIDYHHDIPFRKFSLEVPIPETPLVKFYIEPGLFFDASATITGSINWSQTFNFGTAFDYSSKGKNVTKPTLGGRFASSDFDIETCLDGKISAGMYVELGLRIMSSDISRICARGEFGGEFISDFMISNDDIKQAENNPELYERLEQSSFEVNAFVKTSAEASVSKWGISQSLPWNISKNINTWDVVPTFYDVTFEQSAKSQSTARASVNMEGNCFIPVKVGLSVRNSAGVEVNDYIAKTKFENGRRLLYEFKNLSKEENLYLYPKIKLFGFDMLAHPSTKLALSTDDDMPVKIIGFRQINEEDWLFWDDSFYDRQYRYEYFIEVTMEVTKSENLLAWGFKYYLLNETGNGRSGSANPVEFDCLPGKYSLETVIYSFEPIDTLCIYEYYDYIDDSEWHYGKPQYFQVSYAASSCPDNNHPHWIDLGLPSGTLWQCCNVGASKPEDFGTEVGFGVFSHVNAPTVEQFQELMDYTDYSFYHPVNRLNTFQRFRGKNGKSIILPHNYREIKANYSAPFGSDVENFDFSYWTSTFETNIDYFSGEKRNYYYIYNTNYLVDYKDNERKSPFDTRWFYDWDGHIAIFHLRPVK